MSFLDKVALGGYSLIARFRSDEELRQIKSDAEREIQNEQDGMYGDVDQENLDDWTVDLNVAEKELQRRARSA